jgi:hypothetical protein
LLTFGALGNPLLFSCFLQQLRQLVCHDAPESVAALFAAALSVANAELGDKNSALQESWDDFLCENDSRGPQSMLNILKEMRRAL